ncbi:MAG: GNAT family N-acetyltransferase [Candidatus Hydrogenedentales bacterium]|jgi:predicted acetyltransferase
MVRVLIKSVETADERKKTHDLITRVHYGGTEQGRKIVDTFIGNYPDYYEKEHTRILLVNGQVAACCCLFTHTIRVGESRLKMGGIGYVTTAAAQRKKGYASLLMEDMKQYMESHGYHLSMLFGIKDFYSRWGFTAVLPDYASIIELKEAKISCPIAYKERPIKPGDIPTLLRLHNKNDTESTCSVLRSFGHVTARYDQWQSARVLTDVHGKVVGYSLARYAGDEMHVDELEAISTDCFPLLLHHCALSAEKECASKLRFHLPPSHPFIRYILRYRSVHETYIYRNNQGMMALVNLEETLESMQAEWEAALSFSAMADEVFCLTLIIDQVPYRIRTHHGIVDIARQSGENKLSISSEEFLQLMTGYHYVQEILSGKQAILTQKAQHFLKILFPKRTPYVWKMDRF